MSPSCQGAHLHEPRINGAYLGQDRDAGGRVRPDQREACDQTTPEPLKLLNRIGADIMKTPDVVLALV